jgi:hypothetical protein
LTITPYEFSRFGPPVDNPPIVNATNAGRAADVHLAGDHGLKIFDPGQPKVQRVDCASGAALDEVEQTHAAGASSLTYSRSTDTYTYVWKTERAAAGSCCQLVLASMTAPSMSRPSGSASGMRSRVGDQSTRRG